MTSVRRLGVTVASVATVVAVAGVFAAQGYMSAQQGSVLGVAGAADTASPQTVYVRPAPSAQVIHVTQTVQPSGPPPVIHVIVPSTGGDDGPGDD